MRNSMLALLLVTASACSAETPRQDVAGGGGTGRANLTKTAPTFASEKIGAFDEPFAMAFLPGGALLVTEKAGHLKLRRPDGTVVAVSGGPAVATSNQGGQGGLLDVAVAPDFARSHLLYLTYSEPRPGGSSLAMMRATLSTDIGPAPALSGQRVLWRAGSDGKGGQFGAVIAFAPDGRSLFLASGERQRFTPAQDPDQALGKIFHLTLDGAPAPDNLQGGTTGAATIKVIDPPKNSVLAATARTRTVAARSPNTTPAETWSSGHRNPYGLAFAPDGTLWLVEMGPKGGDELNVIAKGRNYGWPVVSNGDNYDGTPIPDHDTDLRFEAPKLWWNPSISPGGMIIYTGTMFPAWRGSALIAALSDESLIRVTLNGQSARPADQWTMNRRIRDIAQAPDGSVWLLGDDGVLLRITPS